jgi:hypothetical protein
VVQSTCIANALQAVARDVNCVLTCMFCVCRGNACTANLMVHLTLKHAVLATEPSCSSFHRMYVCSVSCRVNACTANLTVRLTPANRQCWPQPERSCSSYHHRTGWLNRCALAGASCLACVPNSQAWLLGCQVVHTCCRTARTGNVYCTCCRAARTGNVPCTCSACTRASNKLVVKLTGVNWWGIPVTQCALGHHQYW